MKNNSTNNNHSKFRNGEFIPIHPEKYKGTTPIYYRSSYELELMRYMDNEPNVIQWGSESNVIMYRSPKDNKMHRYFVDNYAVYKQGDKIYRFLIEVKPFNKLIKPKATQGKKKSTLLQEEIEYSVNMAKWQAATEWAKQKGYIFRILTEKEIFNK